MTNKHKAHSYILNRSDLAQSSASSARIGKGFCFSFLNSLHHNRKRAAGFIMEIGLHRAEEWKIMGRGEDETMRERDAEKNHHLINKRRRTSFDIWWYHAGYGHVKKLLLRHSVHSLCRKSIVSLLKLPLGWTRINCKRHGGKEIVGREETTERLMQALRCWYRLIQPLSYAAPAYLLKAKKGQFFFPVIGL